MDMTGIKPLIISAGIGSWYPAGIDRLERSLVLHGYAGDMKFYRNEYPPHCPPHEQNPYAFKIAMFREAFAAGRKIVCWLDSSFWCIKNPHELFDVIFDKGVFAFRSGYNCAQTCPDNLLAAVGFTRDDAELFPEIATGIVGINIDNPDGKSVFDTWASYCDSGLFINDRVHNPMESADLRYLHGRQDQSAFSMAVHSHGLQFNYLDYVAYYNNGKPGYNPDKCLFFIGGL
jgi:hypothetical protein